MLALTALNNARCTLRPEAIAAVQDGAPVRVVLTNGLAIDVRETAAEVRELLSRAARREPAGRGQRRPAPVHGHVVD